MVIGTHVWIQEYVRDVFVIDRVDMVESLFSDACIRTQSRVHTAGNYSKQANNDVSPIVS